MRDVMWLNTGMTKTQTTHEEFIQQVRDIVVADALRRETITADEATKLSHTKLVYGLGDGSYRGVCHYQAWQNGVGAVDAVEIAATAEESWVQLAGTTIHELGHVLAGSGAGHSNDWKDAAVRLGFQKRPAAAGQRYTLSLIRFRIRHEVYALAEAIADGRPEFATFGLGLGWLLKTLRPCSQGTGTRGGTSRGKGSGSRLRLWECKCTPKPVKVRIASDDFAAHCDTCGSAFARKS
jgi:hypothetical protein